MFKRLIISFFILNWVGGIDIYPCLSDLVCAQEFVINQLPVPGTMVDLSRNYDPVLIKGLKIHPENPFLFDFIVDQGKSPLTVDRQELKSESEKMVKYFLAGLTIPEGDLWVNLSPYEKNRIIPNELGQTALGRDMLAQDYVLKQLSASLIYPEKELGKEFWSKIYSQTLRQFGTTDIPVNTFNKVWILPDQSQVYENGNAVYVTKATLKVMLEEDYLALEKNQRKPGDMALAVSPSRLPTNEGLQLKAPQGTNLLPNNNPTHTIASQILRAIILPQLEHEINEGQNFASLRQIYGALILAKWYKETIQNTLLQVVYTNKKKTAGIRIDPSLKEQIYQRYLQAYKKGVFNYIKEAQTRDGQMTPRKYFSGGEVWQMNIDHGGTRADVLSNKAMVVTVDLQKRVDKASVSKSTPHDGEVTINKDFKPGIEITTFTLDPRIMHPHILVNTAIEDKLYPVDRQTNGIFFLDSEGTVQGAQGVRSRIPPISQVLRDFEKAHPGFQIHALSSNENLFYNKPIVTVRGNRVYYAIAQDIERLEYPMLVVWPDNHVSIEKHVRLKFTDREKRLVNITINGKDKKILYATVIQLIKDKQGFVSPGTQIPFYDDVRHIFALPKFSEDDIKVYKLMSGGLFFMADQLLENKGRLIKEHFEHPDQFQRFSLKMPIPITLGGVRSAIDVSPEDLRRHLLEMEIGYQPGKDFYIDAVNKFLYIRLKENVYPFHIIGITPKGNVKEIVTTGESGKKGLTLREAAKLAQQEGLEMAGIIDQGSTVHLDVNGKSYGNSTVDKNDPQGSHATSVIVYLKENPSKAMKSDSKEEKIVQRGLPLIALNDRKVLDVFRQIVRRRYDVRILSELYHLGAVPKTVTYKYPSGKRTLKITPQAYADLLVDFMYRHRNEDPYEVAELFRKQFPNMARPPELNKIFDEYMKIKIKAFDLEILKAALKPNSVVADIGAGTSLLGEEILKYSNEHNLGIKHVILTDIEDDILLPPHADHRLKFFNQISPVSIPIPSMQVDTVIIKWVTHHIDDNDLRKFLISVCRILKPGGKLFIFDALVTDGDDPFFEWNFDQEILNPQTWPQGSFYKENLKLSRDFMKLTTEQQKMVHALEDYFGHNLIMGRSSMPQKFNYKSARDFERHLSSLNMQEDLSLTRVLGHAPIMRMGPHSIMLGFTKMRSHPYFIPGDGGEYEPMMLGIEDATERQKINDVLSVLDPDEFSKSGLEALKGSVDMEDIVLLASDRIDTMAEALTLLDEGIGKRIVVLGRMDPVPLMDKVASWGYRIQTPKGMVTDVRSWERIKATIEKGMDQERIESEFTGTSVEIIRQMMIQMVQNRRGDFPNLSPENFTNDNNKYITTTERITQKKSSDDPISDYRIMVRSDERLFSKRPKIIFISHPLAQLGNKMLLQDAFFRELRVDRRRVELLSHTVVFDNGRNVIREDAIKELIKNAWETLIDNYSKREKIVASSDRHYLYQIDHIGHRFWDALVYLLGRLDEPQRVELAKELYTASTAKVEIGKLLGSINAGIVKFVSTIKETANHAMINNDSIKNGGIDLNRIRVHRTGTSNPITIDPAQISAFMQGGFDGFLPVIIKMTPIQNPLALLESNHPFKTTT